MNHSSGGTRGASGWRLAALFAVGAVISLITSTPAGAVTLEPWTVEEMAARAATVIVADTIRVESRDVSRDRGARPRIESEVALGVTQILKGRPRASLEISLDGGAVAGSSFLATWEPRFREGEKSIIFLDASGRPLGPQAKLDVVQGRVPALDQSVAEVASRVSGAAQLGPFFGPATSSASFSLAEASKARAEAVPPDRLYAGTIAPASSSSVLLDDGFEPGGYAWEAYTQGGPYWVSTTARASSGSYSAYCDDTVPAGGPYSTSYNSWLIAGPFDLSDATEATLTYDFFTHVHLGDALAVVFSKDKSAFSGFSYGMNSGGKFITDQIDLGNIPITGANYLGEPQLWIAYVFASDASPNTREGAYVDNVRLVKNPPIPSIASMDPLAGSAGTSTTVTIKGERFGDIQGTGGVDFTYDSLAGTTLRAPIESWSDTEVVTYVPRVTSPWAYPGAAGSGPVSVTNADGGTSTGVDFAVTFAYGGLKWDAFEVPYRLNANTADTPNEEALFDAAAATWNAASRFRFLDDGASTQTAGVSNGRNDIYWTSTELPAGVLAAAGIWYTGNTITEADIAFNDNKAWGDGGSGTYDIQSLATHELGHWLNLRDLYGDADKPKVMYGYGNPSSVKRSLDPGDIAGVRWIYPGGVERIYGADRYETAVAIASEHFTSADVTTAVIATGQSFADALSASGLAGAYDSPLLLTRKDGIPSSVATLLATYTGLQKIWVIGGESAISLKTESALTSYAPSVERIAGTDRYSTSAEVARRIQTRTGGAFAKTVLLARGDSFADALAMSPVAYAGRYPLLLTRTEALPNSVGQVIGDLGITAAAIGGGTSAVGVGVQTTLDALLTANGGTPSSRWADTNRYSTAAAIAGKGVALHGLSYAFVGIATGGTFPDGLAGGAATGQERGVLLLSSRSALSAPAAAALTANLADIEEVELFGGVNALSSAVFDGTLQALK